MLEQEIAALSSTAEIHNAYSPIKWVKLCRYDENGSCLYWLMSLRRPMGHADWLQVSTRVEESISGPGPVETLLVILVR